MTDWMFIVWFLVGLSSANIVKITIGIGVHDLPREITYSDKLVPTYSVHVHAFLKQTNKALGILLLNLVCSNHLKRSTCKSLFL